MSAGIYINNGVLGYSKNLEKKLKRRKQAIIVEIYKGEEGEELEKELQKMYYKHINITKKERIEPLKDMPFKYHWKNKLNNNTLHSIYPTITHIPGINLEEWEPKAEVNN